MGVEPIIAIARMTIAGFEDRDDHRTACASERQFLSLPHMVEIGKGAGSLEVDHKSNWAYRYHSLSQG